MEIPYSSVFAVLGFAAAAMVLSWLYFRRFRVTRPPVGVFNLTDIAYMMVSIILVPYLYLVLPLWLVAGLLILGSLSILHFLWEPILRTSSLIWLVNVLLLGADVWASRSLGNTGNGFFLVNNLVLLLIVVGLCNLWAQSGMKARDITVLGTFLMIYDLIATSLLPFMTQLVVRLSDLPLSPMFAWAIGSNGAWLGVGLGDLLVASVFPLVMRKAFGRPAGIVAVGIALVAMSAIMLVALTVTDSFPVMAVLDPLMIVQYLFWSRRQGLERSTWQYLQAEPLALGKQ